MIKFPFTQPPKKTMAYLKDKKIVTSFDVFDVFHKANHTSFTVLKLMKLDILADIHNSLLENQKSGKSFKKWKKELIPLLKDKGWYGVQEVENPITKEVKKTHINSRRLRTIYSTNIRTAHNVGKYHNIYNDPINEYLRYNATLDSRTRPAHQSYHGIVKHRNDKFWKHNLPLNGFNCRCSVRAYSKADLERNNLSVDNKVYDDFADIDFSYDVRFLDKETLNSIYYKRALNYHKSCIEVENNAKGNISCKYSNAILKDTLDNIQNNLRLKDYHNWINKIISDKHYPHDIIAVGAMNKIVYDYLSKKNIEVQNPNLLIQKRQILNLYNATLVNFDKDNRLNLDLREIKNIPTLLKNPFITLWDNNDNTILYICNSSNKDIFIMITTRYNQKKNKEKYNIILNTNKIDIKLLNEKIADNSYSKVS